MFFVIRNADVSAGQVRRHGKLEAWEKYLKIKAVVNGAPNWWLFDFIYIGFSLVVLMYKTFLVLKRFS